MVIPCYNEEEELQDTTYQLVTLLKDLISEGLVSNRSFILFVDDGSKDSTWKFFGGQSQKYRYNWFEISGGMLGIKMLF